MKTDTTTKLLGASSAMRKPKINASISIGATGANLPHSKESGLIAALLQPSQSGRTYPSRPTFSASSSSSSFSQVSFPSQMGSTSHLIQSPLKMSAPKMVDITSEFSAEVLEGMDMDAVRKGDDGSSVLRWTNAEDNLLRKAVTKCGPRDWRLIAVDYLGGARTDVQCLHRWQKVLRPGLVKGPWTKEEDNTIINCRISGVVKWSEIASHVKGRIGKQCRERWFNHLDPNINKSEWTVEEDRKLFEGQALLGNKWSQIAKLFLPGRPENAVKNRWNAATRRRRSSNKRNKETGSVIKRTPRPAGDRPKRHQALTKVQQRFKALRPEYNIRNVGEAMEGMLTLATLASASVGQQQQQLEQQGSMTSSGVVVLGLPTDGSNKRKRDNQVYDETDNAEARRARSNSTSQATDLASALASIASAGRARERSAAEELSSLGQKLLMPLLPTHALRTSQVSHGDDVGGVAVSDNGVVARPLTSNNDKRSEGRHTTSWMDSRPTGLDTSTTTSTDVYSQSTTTSSGISPLKTPKSLIGATLVSGGIVGVPPPRGTVQLSPSVTSRAAVPEAFKGRAVSFDNSSAVVGGDVCATAGVNGTRRDTADALAALHFMRRPVHETGESKEILPASVLPSNMKAGMSSAANDNVAIVTDSAGFAA